MVVPGRLKGRRVAVLFVGPIDRGVSFAIGKAVRDAGGAVVRTRSIGVPIDVPAVQDALRRLPAFRRLQGADQLDDLGDALADELAAGGKTPLWDALGEVIVQEREGPAAPPADAVVVARSADPQRGATKAFLAGLYTGLARSGAPAVGTEASGTAASAIPAFSLAGLSTVDSVDTSAGRLGARLAPRRRRARELRPLRGCARRGPARDSSFAVTGVTARLSVLVAARDEEQRIGETIEALRTCFPDATIVVADDGSRDANRRRRRAGRGTRDQARVAAARARR